MFFRHYKAFIASVSVSVAGLCAAAEAVPSATLGFADPFVLLENGTYYAYGTYAGDGIAVAVSKGRVFWDPDYAVGYALADKPEGPWRKSASNPILRRFRGPPPAAPICNYDSPPKRDFDILFLFKK